MRRERKRKKNREKAEKKAEKEAANKRAQSSWAAWNVRVHEAVEEVALHSVPRAVCGAKGQVHR